MNVNIVHVYIYVNNVLYVYNCIYKKAIKPYCIFYLDTKICTHTCVIQDCETITKSNSNNKTFVE